jgi:uncharacterized protein YrrD
MSNTGSQQYASLREVYACELVSRKGKGLGSVDDVLFHPTELRALGLLVKRAPGLISVPGRPRKPLCVELGALRINEDGAFVLDTAVAKQGKAAERAMGLTWDETVIFYGMPLYTEAGQRLGKVSDARFGLRDGRLAGLEVTAGAASDLALGKRVIPADLLLCFHVGTAENEQHALIVRNEAAELVHPGGLAAAAGTTVAKAAVAAGIVGKKVAGSTVARAAGSRVKGLWDAFASGYKEELNSDDNA